LHEIVYRADNPAGTAEQAGDAVRTRAGEIGDFLQEHCRRRAHSLPGPVAATASLSPGAPPASPEGGVGGCRSVLRNPLSPTPNLP